VKVILGHVPNRQVEPGRPVLLTVNSNNPAPEAEVFLNYRNSPETAFQRIPMKKAGGLNGNLEAEIPGADARPGILEYYFEASGGYGGPFGSSLEGRGPYRVYVSDDRDKPVIEALEPPAGIRGSHYRITVKAADKSGLAFVRLRYKAVPADRPWLTLEMKAGSGGEYEAEVPLTPAGILYYFQAGDNAGNVGRYPDFLERTPYFAIPPWKEDDDKSGVRMR
jgi:hypothetical protein